jgi:glucosamine--fructose-6-phosphate aminotransferase (isomerizing)
MTSLFEAEAAEIPQLAGRQFKRLRTELAPVVARLDTLSPPLLATIARGSSDNAAALVAYLAGMRLRMPTASLPPSLASVYGTTLRLQRALVLAISQSGESPDLNLAVEHAQAGGGFALGLINQSHSALGDAVDVTLEIGAGREVATAATKSFVLSVTAGIHLVAAWARDVELIEALAALPDAIRQSAPSQWGDALALFGGAGDAFVVGRGPSLPVAQELALKFKEVCGIHAEALSAAELLHGPISIAAPGRPALVLAGDARTQPSLDEAVARLLAAGSPVVMVCGEDLLAKAAARAVRVPEAGHPILQPVAALCAIYPFVAELGRLRGRDPDRPPHIAKVTRTL